ncbi:MAG: HYR domain-containing protein, partial [Flavobacteriaceae bacterium]
MKKSLLTLLLGVFMMFPFYGQNFTKAPNNLSSKTQTFQGPLPGTTTLIQNGNTRMAPVTITQSTTQNITPGNSVTCNAGGVPTDNSFFRAFDLSTYGITDDFNVTDVEFGFEAINGSYTVTVNVYSMANGTFPASYPGGATLQGTASATYNAGNAGSIVSLPLSATIPAGEDLIYELFFPNDQGIGNVSVFPASNAGGQSAPSYLQAAACGVTSPFTTASIGFPNMHLVFNVVGEEVAAQSSYCAPAGTNGQAGTYFQVEALTNMNLTSIDGDFDAVSCNIQLWTRPGSHVGFEGSNAGWTLLGTATITGGGIGNPVPLPIAFNIPLTTGNRQSFHLVTTNNTAQNYRTGTGTVGVTVAGSNADLVHYAGCGSTGLFSGCNFSPRNFQGCVHYTTAGPVGDPPVISCPANITADNAAGQCGAVVNFAAVAVDTEDGNISGSIVYTPDTGSFFPVGTTTVTASVTDSDGNTSECTFDVTVNDVENPVATCSDITVDLDATGNVTVFPGDVASVTDNCPGTTLQFQGIGGPSGAITTLFNSNNGGANGWTVMYDLTVGASDIEITGFDMNTSSTSAFNLEVYTLVGTFVGNQTNAGAWTLTATGSGTGAGTNNPSNVTLGSPMALSAGTTYGIALRMVNAAPQYSGTGTNPAPGSTSYSNADLSLSLGSAVSGLFTGSVFTPRIWNGTIYYGSPAPPVPSLDFT